MRTFLTFVGLMTMSLTVFAKAEDFILCRYYGANYPAVKINLKDLEVGKCPILLPSNLKDFQFRVSRHQNSGLLRIVIENKKSRIWMRSLGGDNQVSVSLALSDADGKAVANQVGLPGFKTDEIKVSCGPSNGLESEHYLLVKASENCSFKP